MNLNVLSSSRSSSLFSFFLIVLVCFLSYSNTFHVPFQFDDPPNISESPYVRDISAFFDPTKIEQYRSDSAYRMRTVGYFTLAVNYLLHGTDVTGYHIVNLTIHILNAILVYFLVLLTFRTPFFKSEKSEVRNQKSGARGQKTVGSGQETGAALIALFTALLFVSHPVQTQAVTYIVQRLASLAALFYLLSLVMYIKWRLLLEQKRGSAEARQSIRNGQETSVPISYRLSPITFFSLSLLSAVLAMKTKEIAFTLPLIITLYELLFFAGPLKKRALWLLPLLLTMAIIPLELHGLGRPTGEIIGDMSDAMLVAGPMSRLDYMFTEFRVIVTYIRLLFFPVNQNLDYDYPVYHSFFTPPVFLSFLFLLSLLGAAVYLLFKSRKWVIGNRSWEKESPPLPATYHLSPTTHHPSPTTHHLSPIACYRLAAFGIFWFFISLSVESSIIPITDVIFEHRLYLPSVGAFIAVMSGLSITWKQIKEKGQWPGQVALGALCLIVVILSGATYARNTVWQSELSLWEDVLQKSPAKVRAHNNLGLALMDRGDVDKAADVYAQAIALGPNVAEPHYNLGKAYEKNGLYDKAIEEYTKAVALKPDFTDAYFDLGVAYASKGMRDEAIIYYKTALRVKPDFARAHFNLGVSYLAMNLAKEARDEFEAALRSDPSLDQARQFLEYARKLQ